MRYIDAILNAGDCLYVPAYYYVQSKSIADDESETIIYNQQYASHSLMVDLILNGIEENGLDDTDHSSFDKMAAEYMNKYIF